MNLLKTGSILRRLLIITPVVVGLIWVSLFMPAQRLSIEGIGMLSLEATVTLSVGYEVASANPGWVSPTGEVLNGWGGSGLAWDDNTVTSSSYDAGGGSWTPYIELTHASLQCTSVQVWVGAENDNMSTVEVGVFYNSGWNIIYEGAPTLGSFAEYTVIGGEQAVTAMRIRCLNSHGQQARFQYVFEADFYEVVAEPDITVSPTDYNFGVVAESATPSTTTNYFAITNNSTMQTDQTISVTTSTWSGGDEWTHSDTATQGANTAGLLANRGGTWGTGDIIIKNISPNYIYENCPATTDYSFGLKLLAPTSFSDGVQKQIIVRITAVAG